MTSCFKKFTIILSSKNETKETATVRRSLIQGCSSNKTEKMFIYLHVNSVNNIENNIIITVLYQLN